MTDEERARELAVKCVGIISDKERIAAYALEAFTAIRAGQRENDAIACEVHAATVRGPKSGTPWSAAHECAAAIRAMGDKG